MKFEIDLSGINIHIHIDQQEAPGWATELKQLVSRILDNQETKIMPTIEELQAKADATLASVTAETDIDDAIAGIINSQNATITDLKAQLAAAGTDPQKLQALSDTLDNILAINTANAQKVADAVTANTAPAPTPDNLDGNTNG